MSAATPSRLGGMRVLVVDDDAEGVEPVCTYLRGLGADVRQATSAIEGLILVEAFRPHAVLTDVSMPVVDGYSFLARLRALPESSGGRTPAVAVSAVVFPEHSEWAVSAGFDTFLAKPVDPCDVADTLARLRPAPPA